MLSVKICQLSKILEGIVQLKPVRHFLHDSHHTNEQINVKIAIQRSRIVLVSEM